MGYVLFFASLVVVKPIMQSVKTSFRGRSHMRKASATLCLDQVSILFEVISFAAGIAAPIDDHLEQLRMALTNAPVDRNRVAAAWASVLPSLRELASSAPESHPVAVLESLDARMNSILSGSATVSSPLTSPPSVVPAYKLKSCYVQQEMHKVLPGLFLGSYHPASSRTTLDAQGITHVCCCINVSPRFPDAYTYLVLPADDNADYDMSQFFSTSFRFIDDALSSGGHVLVHCGAGISRAPTVVASYLIQKLHLGAEDAVHLIKSVRSCASPNRGFMQQLKALAESEKGVHATTFNAPH